MMGYSQFKKVWLSLVDVRAELRNRHERFNRFLPNGTLVKKLQLLVNLEEQQEAKTLLEAANSLSDEQIARERRDLVQEALLLSRVVIAEALDAAGQVYLFGKGSLNCFDGDPMEPDFIDFMEYELVKELWRERVRPDTSSSTLVVPAADGEGNRPENDGDAEQRSGAIPSAAKADPQKNLPSKSNKRSPSLLPSRPRVAVAAAAQAFGHRQVSLMTAFLWGKRVKQISCGSVVVYAVTDSGEVFCWGGNKRSWRYFYDHDTLSAGAEGYTVDRPHSRGGEQSLDMDQARPLTARSEMLKLSVPSQVVENQKQHDQLNLRKKYRKTFVQPERILPTEEQKRHKLSLVGRYYDLMPSLNPSAPSPTPSLQELMETVEPELNVDDLALSLQLRGVYLAKQTRIELIEKLGDCLELELECIGEKFHEHMKEQDKITRRLRHDRRENQMLAVAAKTAVLWHELCILLGDIVKIEHDTFSTGQVEYLEMKRKIMAAKQKVKRQAREGCSNQESTEGKQRQPLLHLNGLTSRGSPLQNFNGQHALEDIAVGSRHVLAIHQSGKLLTWGVGSFGRLGGAHESKKARSQSDPDSWHSDVHAPEVVDALQSFRFRSVACGFGHSLALSNRGQVFVWGSAAHGKLGIGKIDASESFTLAPMPLPLPSGLVVRKIACGPSHSALLTTDGGLYVWGCGDGGKLGLGDGRDVGQNRVPRNGGNLGVLSTPTRVLEPFAREKLVEVSCGTGHTAVLSATTKRGDGSLVGGRVYVAGSNHALAKFTPSFTLLPIVSDDNEAIVISKVSCGNAHTALVSSEGELFTWGKNVGGCTGHSTLLPLVKTPTRVSCMYQRPANLCLRKGVSAVQSTQNATCLPDYALRSESGESSRLFAQTQQEMCPFWQVTLQSMSRIERVRVVLWRSREGDDSSPLATQRTSTSSSATLKYSVLISEFPFDTEERGKYSLAKAKGHSTHVGCSFPNDRDEWVWTPPVDTFGRFVRIQLDNAMGMLSLSAVEVMGMHSSEYRGPRVSEVTCGEAMTAVVCRPLSSVDMLRERFLRAVRADRASLWILEQIETFHPFLQEELAVFGNRGRSCALCRPNEKCAVCLLEDAVLSDGKMKPAAKSTGSDRSDSTTKQKEAEKRESLLQLTLDELCQRLLTMNMRTEEEEAEQQKQLEQELLDINVLAREKQRDEVGAQALAKAAPAYGLLEKLRRTLGFKSISQSK